VDTGTAEQKLSRSPFRRLYNWFLGWADKPNSERALVGFSVAEAIFFPIPPDPLLMALVFAKPKRWWQLALKTTIASLLGGIVGYFVGRLLFEGFGQWLLDTYHLQAQYESLGNSFRSGTFIAVLAAAMTPIPYKLVTLTAGAFYVNFFIFLLASAIGRSSRFFAVAYLSSRIGANHRDKIERYIDGISIALLLLVAMLFWFLR
jgi:membrane protein YqaA with SNARE-associated domain